MVLYNDWFDTLYSFLVLTEKEKYFVTTYRPKP